MPRSLKRVSFTIAQVPIMEISKNLNQILNLLGNHKEKMRDQHGVLSLAVFGSHVRDEQTTHSDVDILVQLQPEYLTFDNFMELKFFLEELLQKKIDLAIKESIREELKAGIFQEAIYV